MALYALGPVLFDIKANLEGVSIDSDSGFARHDVYGAAPVYEDVGDGETTVRLSGTVLPYLFGGLDGLALLRTAREAKIPLPLMRGDFAPLGWYVIGGISETHDALDPREGIGMEIKWEVRLTKVGTPALSGAADILRLFL